MSEKDDIEPHFYVFAITSTRRHAEPLQTIVWYPGLFVMEKIKQIKMSWPWKDANTSSAVAPPRKQRSRKTRTRVWEDATASSVVAPPYERKYEKKKRVWVGLTSWAADLGIMHARGGWMRSKLEFFWTWSVFQLDATTPTRSDGAESPSSSRTVRSPSSMELTPQVVPLRPVRSKFLRRVFRQR